MSNTFDLSITSLVQSITNPFFSTCMEVLSRWGEADRFVFLMALVGAYFVFRKQYRLVSYLYTSTLLAAVVGITLKALINRPRPSSDEAIIRAYTDGSSFPSNHVLVYTVFFGFLFYIFQKKKVSILFLIPIIFISISRIYMGAHWFSDCLASYFISWIILDQTIKKYHSK